MRASPSLRAYVMNELSRHISVLDVRDEGTLSLAKEVPYHVEGATEDDVQGIYSIDQLNY